MDEIDALHRRARLIEVALADLDDEARLGESDAGEIEREREALGRLLAAVEDRLCAAA